MARARNIKPAFFKNEYLGELSIYARMLFIGLWTLADREGRLEDRPKRIKAEIFPYDEVDVDSLLDELASHEGHFIIRYNHCNDNYIQILNFIKHQHPHHKEQTSTIPAPGENNKNPRQTPGMSGANPEQARLIPDSPILNPSSLIPDSPTPIKEHGEEEDGVDRIWLYYESKLQEIGKTRKRTDSKIKHIRARLQEFNEDQIKTVIDNVFKNRFMLGENDKGKTFIEIENFLRNTEKVEVWLDNEFGGSSQKDDQYAGLGIKLDDL